MVYAPLYDMSMQVTLTLQFRIVHGSTADVLGIFYLHELIILERISPD